MIVGFVWRILGGGGKKAPPLPLRIREQPRKSPSWIGLILEPKSSISRKYKNFF